MNWQDRYHQNLNNGMRDSEAFDDAFEASMEEQECYDIEMKKYAESYIAEQFEEYVKQQEKQ
jgi:hypothetical protein